MPYLLFLKKQQIFDYRLLPIVGGALRVNGSFLSDFKGMNYFLRMLLHRISCSRIYIKMIVKANSNQFFSVYSRDHHRDRCQTESTFSHLSFSD